MGDVSFSCGGILFDCHAKGREQPKEKIRGGRLGEALSVTLSFFSCPLNKVPKLSSFSLSRLCNSKVVQYKNYSKITA